MWERAQHLAQVWDFSSGLVELEPGQAPRAAVRTQAVQGAIPEPLPDSGRVDTEPLRGLGDIESASESDDLRGMDLGTLTAFVTHASPLLSTGSRSLSTGADGSPLGYVLTRRKVA